MFTRPTSSLVPRYSIVPSWVSPALSLALACSLAAVGVEGRASEDARGTDAARQSAQSPKMPHFPVYQYAVDGNSLLSNLAIEKALDPFLGEDKTLLDIEGARAGLEKAYHDAGYLTVVVSIPEQTVDEAEVKLHVVEAEIDQLTVKGARHVRPSGIKAGASEVAEGNVPNFNELQKQLAVLNRSPDARVTPILRAGRVPGTVDVQLDVDDQPALHGGAEFSNRQSLNTTAERLGASLRYDDLWHRGHSIGLTLQTAPQRPSDSRMWSLNYVFPLNAEGDAITAYRLQSRSQFDTLAGAPGLGLLGNTNITGIRYAPRLGASGDYVHSFSIGLDRKDIKQTLVVPGGLGSNTPISYTPLVASYSGSQSGNKRNTAFDIAATAGMGGLLGNSEQQFDAKRSGASASFLSLRGGLAHTEEIFRWSVYGKLEVQTASGPLLPSEQFTIGGAESVRGYYEGERIGDSGARATLELRTPQFNPGGDASPWRLSGRVFYDAAKVAIQNAVAPQASSHRLRGSGVGFRLAAPYGISLEVDAARALVDGDVTRAGDKRIHARSVWSF